MANNTDPVKVALGKFAKFEGDTVRAVALELPTLAGGLRDAVTVDPYYMHRGDKAYLIVEVDCDNVNHQTFVDKNAGEKKADRIGTGGDCTRVQVLVPGVVAFADADLVKDVIDNMRDRVKAQADIESGQPQIEGLADGSEQAGTDDES